jgi:hypothetical protein
MKNMTTEPGSGIIGKMTDRSTMLDSSPDLRGGIFLAFVFKE